MDSELITYLIFLGLALLLRTLGKKKKQTPPQQSTQDQTGTSRPAKPAKSFEELLEEFTGGRQQEDEMERDSPPRMFPRKKQKEEEFTSDEGTGFSFENQEKLKSIDELVDIEKVKTKSSLVSPEEEEAEREEHTIAEMLKNPDDARKAIILGEIINRKYH